MEMRDKSKKVDILQYVAKNKENFKKYKNIEELTIRGKRKFVRKSGKEDYKVVCINQYGSEVLLSEVEANYGYTLSENGKLLPKDNLTLIAMPVDKDFWFVDSTGEYKDVQKGDFIVIKKTKIRDIYTSMNMFDFAEKYVLSEKSVKEQMERI